MLKKSYKIIDVFVKNPTTSYLFNEVKDLIKSKSESYTYNSINYFVKEGILEKEKRGNFVIYKIANNYKSISFLSFVAEYNAWDKKNIPFDSINEVINKININFFTLLVTGSYVKGKQTINSDLDVVIIVPDNPKKIIGRLRHFCEMNIPFIHLYVFSDDEFKQMLLDEKHNYGKEIVKNNLVFYGAETFYKILFEVMKHGFSY
jgi:hypothetical protein